MYPSVSPSLGETKHLMKAGRLNAKRVVDGAFLPVFVPNGFHHGVFVPNRGSISSPILRNFEVVPSMETTGGNFRVVLPETLQLVVAG